MTGGTLRMTEMHFFMVLEMVMVHILVDDKVGI